MLINPTCINLSSFNTTKENIFRGLVKGIIFDLLAQKRILTIQILNSNEEESEKEQIIQIALNLEGIEIIKNQEIDFVITSDCLKFF